MPRSIRHVALLLPLTFITALSSCSGGDSQQTSATSNTGNATLSSGLYSLSLDSALVVCADGAKYPQVFGADVILIADLPLITISDGSQQIGMGDVTSAGAFHANAAFTDTAGSHTITLDGQVNGTTITGDAEAIFTPSSGARCALNTRFTAVAKEGV